MTNEELNTALYKKMYAEQEEYEKWLLAQPPEEILKHAYEFTVRQDILLSLEYHDLTDAQASALLKSPGPLGDIFKEFESRETDYMDTVFESMVSRADAMVEKEEKQRRVLKETPVYPYPAEYARENDELAQYRASHRANIACKEAIESAIAEHYHDNCLGKEAALEVIEAFGLDRTLYVLANTVRQRARDGRISHDNKAWARTVPVYEDQDGFGTDQNIYFVVNAHPGLTDLFLNQVRREWFLQRPLTKEEIRAEAVRLMQELQKQKEPNSPSGTHFMAEISTDFLARGSSKDTDQLMKMLPFRSMAFSSLEGRKGHFLLVPKEENRDQPLRKTRRSVRTKLQQPTEKAKKQNAGQQTPER